MIIKKTTHTKCPLKTKFIIILHIAFFRKVKIIYFVILPINYFYIQQFMCRVQFCKITSYNLIYYENKIAHPLGLLLT